MASPPPVIAAAPAPDPVALAAQVTAAAKVLEGHVDIWIGVQPKAERYEVGVGRTGTLAKPTLDALVATYRTAGWTKAHAGNGLTPESIQETTDGGTWTTRDIAALRYDVASQGWVYVVDDVEHAAEPPRFLLSWRADPRGHVLYLDR